MLEPLSVKVNLENITDDFCGNCEENDHADHDQRGLAKCKNQHGDQGTDRKGNVGSAHAL